MIRYTLAALVLTAAVATAADPAPKPPGVLAIAGPEKVARDKLVRLKADGADPKAGLVWRVYPRGKADRADTASDRDFQFVAPPGRYEVELLAVTVDKDGRVRVDESTHTVTIGGDSGGTDPPKKDDPTDPPTEPVGGQLYFMVVRPDGPASPAFTRAMADPNWRALREAGHEVKDFTVSDARTWFDPAGHTLPVVVTLRLSADGTKSSVVRGAVPLPAGDAILKLPEGL